MLVHAKAARAGVYDYLGIEVDPTGAKFKATDTVKVYRPASEVFDKASLASFVLRPITDDHPTVPVNATNWRDHAGGSIVGAVKDGDHVGFDLAFMDAATVAKIDSGKVELSAGYSCDLAIEDGQTPDGVAYQAVQRNIRGNHVALVDRGRAGPTCRVIADVATCDAIPSLPKFNNDGDRPVKTMLIDGLTVDYANPDTAKATLDTLIAARDDARGKVTAADAKAVNDAATIVARDAEIAKLTKALADAKPTLQQLRDAGKAFAVIEGKAKAAGVAVTDAMDEGAIMKAVVDKAMPGNTYEGEHVRIAFDALTKDVKVNDSVVQPLGAPAVMTDQGTAYVTDRNKARAALSNAWKTPFNAADAAAA